MQTIEKLLDYLLAGLFAFAAIVLTVCLVALPFVLIGFAIAIPVVVIMSILRAFGFA